MRLFFTLFSLITLLLLNACATAPSFNSNKQYPAAYYLDLADNSADAHTADGYRLQAAKRYLSNGDLTQANDLLQQLALHSLSLSNYNEYQLALAQLRLANHQTKTALAILENLSMDELNQRQQSNYYRLTALAYRQNKNLLKSIGARISLNRLLSDELAKKQNSQQIWVDLQNLTPQALNRAYVDANDATLHAWLELAEIAKNNRDSASQLVQALQDWQNQYPHHAANQLLANNLQRQVQQLPEKAQHIALMLPLSGQFAAQGNAVKNGFMLAFYQSNKQAVIDVYDTNSADMSALYQRLQAKNTDFIVGPLVRNKIKALLNVNNGRLPILALNYVDGGSSNLYQFGLSPQQEAEQAAIRAGSQGLSHALLIYPQGQWGEKVANAFQKQWLQQGASIPTTLSYNKKQNLTKFVEKLLGIDNSKNRYWRLRQLLGQKLVFKPVPRSDMDMIFMVANTQTARQIKPLLSFYFVGDLPIYATSDVYPGLPQPKRDRDLNGIRFADMPWIIMPNQHDQHLQSNAKQLWPGSFRQFPRLYALGVDAFSLTQGELSLLKALPNFGLAAASGQLSLDDQQIRRRLEWAEFNNGKPSLQPQFIMAAHQA